MQITTFVCVLFGTAIPTSLNNSLSKSIYTCTIPENEDWIYGKFGTEDSANILIIVYWECWIECSLLEKACELHSTMFGRKEMEL